LEEATIAGPEPESLRVQLENLENRMKHHIVRFWSLPFAYVTVVFITFATIPANDLATHQPLLSIGLLLFGVAASFAMGGALEGTTRAIGEIRRIEKALHLEETPKVVPLHYAPYYALMGIAMLYAVMLLFR
jgi:hypothetical protein